MRKARKQNGCLYLDVNGSKTPVWRFYWRHILPNGKRIRKRRQVGTLDQYKTEAAAERAVRSWRLAINSNQVHAFSGITMNDVIEHFGRRNWWTRARTDAPGQPATDTRATSTVGSGRHGAEKNWHPSRRRSSKNGWEISSSIQTGGEKRKPPCL